MFTVVDVWVDLPDRDNMSQHVTQPLRIQEIQVTQQGAVIVKQDAWGNQHQSDDTGYEPYASASLASHIRVTNIEHPGYERCTSGSGSSKPD